MNCDLERSDLSSVLGEGRALADETKRMFAHLTTEQINWKPGAGEWSIGQCFDHLIISNRPYFSIIEDVRQGKKKQRLWERMPLLPALFGTMLIRVLRPDSGRKAKARQKFLPSASTIDPGIVSDFLDQQTRLLTLMETTRGLDLDRIAITSPVLALVTYSLMNAYRIIVVHEQNHVVQAKRVLETPGFAT